MIPVDYGNLTQLMPKLVMEQKLNFIRSLLLMAKNINCQVDVAGFIQKMLWIKQLKKTEFGSGKMAMVFRE